MPRLHDAAPMKIASGEWLATHWEFEDLIERGKIDVAQPDVGRVGGGSWRAKRVCDFAAARRGRDHQCHIAGKPGCQ